MKNYIALLNNLLQDESGQDLIEYALVACAIGTVAIAVVPSLTTTVTTLFTTLGTKITSATT